MQTTLAIAPLMDWTDGIAGFHRQLTRRAVLYTETVVAGHPRRERLLGFDDGEHPDSADDAGGNNSSVAMIEPLDSTLS